jgi:hypothetical protein
MDASADPSHPNHTDHAAWVAGITGSGGPFDAAFLDITAVNRALSKRRQPGRGAPGCDSLLALTTSRDRCTKVDGLALSVPQRPQAVQLRSKETEQRILRTKAS